MAFDQIPKVAQPSAIQWLKDHGVMRLLTRAGTPETALDLRLQTLCRIGFS
ncbi:MAG: hypothetical protein ACLTZB_01670 [Streptococcus salivarius]